MQSCRRHVHLSTINIHCGEGYGRQHQLQPPKKKWSTAVWKMMHPKLGMLFLKQAQSWTSFIAISILAIILSSTSGKKTVQHHQQHEHPLINHINWAQEFPRFSWILLGFMGRILAPVVSRFFGPIVWRLLEALDPSSAERFLQLVDERLGPQAPNPSWWFCVLMGQK